MTGAGDYSDDDASPCGERARLLRQIADTLNLPLSAFSRRLDPPETQDGPTSAECAAALAAFSRIADPHLRSQCLRMLERCADA